MSGQGLFPFCVVRSRSFCATVRSFMVFFGPPDGNSGPSENNRSFSAVDDDGSARATSAQGPRDLTPASGPRSLSIG